MELVDKPGCKSAVWVGLKCDEEKLPVIDGYAFCRQYKNKVIVHNGNTLNHITYLQNNHSTIYANFAKQRLRRLSSTIVIKAPHNNYQLQRHLLAANLTIKKARNKWNLLIQLCTVLQRDMLPMYSIEKPGFQSMLAEIDK